MEAPSCLNAIVNAAVDRGARLAEPGEFTLRAFLNGRIDLPQAEAVADLIDAATPLQARAAFDQLNGTLTRPIAAIDRALFDLIARLEASVDFPEEGYHFVEPASSRRRSTRSASARHRCFATRSADGLLREGLQVAIVGAPNVGKSSLFNALVGASPCDRDGVPGTTRDLVSETIDLEGLARHARRYGWSSSDRRSRGIGRRVASGRRGGRRRSDALRVDLSTESSASEEETLDSMSPP